MAGKKKFFAEARNSGTGKGATREGIGASPLGNTRIRNPAHQSARHRAELSLGQQLEGLANAVGDTEAVRQLADRLRRFALVVA
jgi:hypothetical protein